MRAEEEVACVKSMECTFLIIAGNGNSATLEHAADCRLQARQNELKRKAAEMEAETEREAGQLEDPTVAIAMAVDGQDESQPGIPPVPVPEPTPEPTPEKEKKEPPQGPQAVAEPPAVVEMKLLDCLK